jgi:hypothetical protein
MGFPQNQPVKGRSKESSAVEKKSSFENQRVASQSPSVFSYVPSIMPDSFVEGTVERVESRCEDYNVPSSYNVSGSD